MSVVLVNGSAHKVGCTYTSLCEVAKELNKAGIKTTIFQLGNKPIAGCIGCNACYGKGRCITFPNDKVNEFLDLCQKNKFDGYVFGSPVHYAHPSGAITSFLDRTFYSSDKSLFCGKLGAAVVNCRRGGATASFDMLNKYFTITNMPIVSSQYWNQTHGFVPDDVMKDLEGLQTMRTLGRNMAWLIKCIKLGEKHGVTFPPLEPIVMTNFMGIKSPGH